MKNIKVYILSFLCLSNVIALAHEGDTVRITNGIIFAKGESYNRQIFLESEDTIIKLSNFKSWEEIYNLHISHDEKLLLIYHKTNKQKGRKLSVMNIDSLKITKTIEPGFGGSLN